VPTAKRKKTPKAQATQNDAPKPRQLQQQPPQEQVSKTKKRKREHWYCINRRSRKRRIESSSARLMGLEPDEGLTMKTGWN
jgi:hypothetical protein